MTNYWAYIAAFGSGLTFFAVAPYLFGMMSITSSMGMGNANVEMVEQVIYLFAGGVMALVPLSIGGAFVFAFFQFAEEMA